MREACIRAVSNAMGRSLTRAEELRIENRIRAAMLQGARENPAGWRAMTEEERLIEAGRRAAREIVAEAQKQEQRVAATIVAHDRIANYLAQQTAGEPGRPAADPHGVAALERTLIHKYDEQNGGFQSVESRANATFDHAMSQIADVFETVNPGLWQRLQSGMISIEPLRRSFVDALHGVRDGIPDEIVRAAERYHEIANALREQFNAAGGVVGKLVDWGSPHNWSARRAERFGKEAFVEDMLAAADRRRYVHDDGRYYNETELRDFFGEAWATIVSDGMTKDTGAPVQFPGGSVKANRHSHHRVIHLMPEAAYHMLVKYSEQNILEAMVGNLRRMSRDVALVEIYGPNADHQFKLQLENAMREAAQIDPTLAQKLSGKARFLENLYDNLAGNNPPPVSRGLADAMGSLRNLQVASKLGSAVITSISDYATLYQTALANNLNPFQVAMNSSLAWAPKSRRYARRMGLMIDTLLADMERFSGEYLTSRDWTARTASAVIRISGLQFVTNARRLGFSMTMMDAIGHLTRQAAYADVTRLAEGDRNILASKGITQETWDIWRTARLDRWGANHTLLTPEAIMAVEGVPFEQRRQAVIDLLSIVREEQDLAVITPGARERTAMMFGTKGGTVDGEMVRSIMLFKSFPWTLLTRHGERAARGNRYTYFGSLFLFMTLGGLAANWINDLLGGRDPRTLNVLSEDPRERSIAVRNLMHGTLKGGPLIVYADVLFSETNQYGGGGLEETILGPNIGTASEALRLGPGNAVQALAGEETNIGSEAVRFARGMTPGANLWMTKGLADRFIFNQLAEMADPGAIDRMRDRQYSNQRTSYWWDPLEPAPEREPDLGAGLGAN